jgi:hypothetical protein
MLRYHAVRHHIQEDGNILSINSSEQITTGPYANANEYNPILIPLGFSQY